MRHRKRKAIPYVTQPSVLLLSVCEISHFRLTDYLCISYINAYVVNGYEERTVSYVQSFIPYSLLYSVKKNVHIDTLTYVVMIF